MKYKLKKDVLWYKAGTIFERDSEGQTYITELDGVRFRTLDALQNAICDHRNEEGSEEYFEKVLAPKEDRKELAGVSKHTLQEAELNVKYNIPTTSPLEIEENVWYWHMRINKDQIRQFHVARRQLSESEIKRVPNKWWVSEQLIDPAYTASKSVLEQYKLRGNL